MTKKLIYYVVLLFTNFHVSAIAMEVLCEPVESFYEKIKETFTHCSRPMNLKYLKTLTKDDKIDSEKLYSSPESIKDLMNPLTFAICAGDVEQVKKFVNQGIDPNDLVFNVWHCGLNQQYSLAHVLLDPFYLYSIRFNNKDEVSGPAYLPIFSTINQASRIEILDALAASGGYRFVLDSPSITKTLKFISEDNQMHRGENSQVTSPVDSKTIKVFYDGIDLCLQDHEHKRILVDNNNYEYNTYRSDVGYSINEIRRKAHQFEKRQSIIHALSHGAILKCMQEESEDWRLYGHVKIYRRSFSVIDIKYKEQVVSLEYLNEICGGVPLESYSSSNIVQLLEDAQLKTLGGECREALVRFASLKGYIPPEINFNNNNYENEDWKPNFEDRKPNFTPFAVGCDYLTPLVTEERVALLGRAMVYGANLIAYFENGFGSVFDPMFFELKLLDKAIEQASDIRQKGLRSSEYIDDRIKELENLTDRFRDGKYKGIFVNK